MHKEIIENNKPKFKVSSCNTNLEVCTDKQIEDTAKKQ